MNGAFGSLYRRPRSSARSNSLRRSFPLPRADPILAIIKPAENPDFAAPSMLTVDRLNLSPRAFTFMSTWIRMGIAISALLAHAGCSPPEDNLPREPISGTVTFAGEPLKKGSIQFIPASSGASVATGSIVVDGKFNVPRSEGPVPGTYKVMIFAEGVSTTSSAEGDRQRTVQNKKEKRGEGLIPLKYNMKSELKADVKTGASNSFTFDLEK